MYDLKYITFDNGFGLVIVMFTPTIEHANMAERLRVDASDVVGAGFVRMERDEAPQCYGRSVSLGVKSDPGDTDILHRHLAV